MQFLDFSLMTVQVLMVQHLLGTDWLYLWIWTGKPKLNHKTWNVGKYGYATIATLITRIKKSFFSGQSILRRLICQFYWQYNTNQDTDLPELADWSDQILHQNHNLTEASGRLWKDWTTPWSVMISEWWAVCVILVRSCSVVCTV